MSVADASRSRHEPPFGGPRYRWGQRIALWLALLLIGGPFGATCYQIHDLIAADDTLQHALDARRDAERLLSLLGSAEDSQKDYLITGDPAYLGSYRAAAAAAPQALQQLSQLFGDSPKQWRRLDELRPLLSGRIDLLEALIATRQDRGLPAIAGAGLDEGRAITERMREVIASVVATETDRAWMRLDSARKRIEDSALVLLAGIVASAMVVLWLFRLKRKEAQRRGQAEAMLRRLVAQLEERVLQQTAEVERNLQFRDALLARMRDGLFVEHEDRIVLANDTCLRLFGAASAAQILGKSPGGLFHGGSDWLSRGPARASSGADVEAPFIERQIVRLDGSRHDVEISAVPLDCRGARETLVLFHDIAERKATEQRLMQAQRMEAIAQLTSGMVHDFNNLLAIVVGGLGQLEKLVTDEGRAQELVRVCMKASQQGAELIDRLLAFSRRQPRELMMIDVNELITWAVDLLRQAFGLGTDIQLRLAEHLWPVLADPVQAESAFINLAINARDAMPDGGRLTIETANLSLEAGDETGRPGVAPGAYVMLAVSDTGIGMTQEVLDRAFEPFFTTKEGGRSSGLGLAMVLGFARQSHGHAEIRSEPSRGTTVRLYLPRAGRTSTTAPASE